jgi:hypothetical protein
LDSFLNNSLPAEAMIGRLIPLNKNGAGPQYLNKIRPITTISPFRKMLELFVKPKLEQIIKNKICKSQTGFIPNLGTELNI